MILEPISPWAAVSGGLLIGAAAALYLLVNGRIAGISGMAATALGIGGTTPRLQAAALIAGLPAGAWLAASLVGSPGVIVTSSPVILIVAGLLVGFGTRLGSGCTSGHGVCGIGRLSPRSLLATVTFMIAGAATVFLMRHVLGI